MSGLGIAKRGNGYVCKLPIHSARFIIIELGKGKDQPVLWTD